jgi:poly-gamma-glutamate synthesis protein (capsule biosynthesis protein)
MTHGRRRLSWAFAVLTALAAISPLARAQHDEVRIVLTGDAILNRRLSVYDDPAYVALFDRVKHADAAFTNLETVIHNFDLAGGFESGGAYQASPPWITDELKWAGFNLLSVANNHTFDWGVDGMRSTLLALDRAGLAHAGAGENLALARAAAYVDTKHGRVALVACASTFTDGALAGVQRPDLRGRPGLSPLRVTTSYTVDQTTLDGLRRALGGGRGGGGSARIGNAIVRAGDTPGSTTTALKDDVDGIVASIRDARRQADWVIVSIHSHEGQANRPPDFLVGFAHAAIDAGADIFVSHGPHVLRGIEIYNGKPIFYGLANFAFENETMLFQPQESYDEQHLPLTATTADYFDARSANDTRGFPVQKAIWESVIAEVTFHGDRSIATIALDPISLGFGEPRSQRGRPRPASGTQAKATIDQIATLSAPFGTIVTFANGQGLVTISPAR